ncbi:ATP-binding protein [Flavobacterium sp.]|uniref:AlbA family DNA-binding domain-containing protein n=1 Tax=Flavobacterium sp. TaxID=239 RepID=UPI0025B9AEF9|nr:ATP-binding protein [Flavobacterium sp.]
MKEMISDIFNVIGKPEGDQLEYKSVLPPARTLGQIICAFANSSGGIIILGVTDRNGQIIVHGLSEDFRANSILHKALDLLSPKPSITYDYYLHQDKRVYVIQIEASSESISIEGKIYQRKGSVNVLNNPEEINSTNTYIEINNLFIELDSYQNNSSGSMSKFIDHYKSLLNIVSDLGQILYPEQPSIATTNNEGRILMRILFSSCADNFETYLSDLLYEIYLAKPDTLKSDQQVSIKEVLNCSDIQEFIDYIAKKKLSKLQRGSVKGFISDNNQIKDLKAITEQEQHEIEKILQIRHLYAHKNGIVDEKFLQYFQDEFSINQQHQLSLDDFLRYLKLLLSMVSKLDNSAINKYQLATV